MLVKWYVCEETKSLASLTNNWEHDLELPSLEFGDLLQKNKCASTFEIQKTDVLQIPVYILNIMLH